MAWEFFKQNFETFKERYAASKSAGDLVFGITHNFANMEIYNEIVEFFQEVNSHYNSVTVNSHNARRTHSKVSK